jgi:hypothetical protein
MDFTDALKAGGASATLIMIIGIAIKLMQSMCGHRLRSECCGRNGTIGVSVENITPTKSNPEVTIVKSKFPPAPTEPAERAVAVGV